MIKRLTRRSATALNVAVIAVTASLGGSLTGCAQFPDRKRAAHDIEDTVRAMPGVASTSSNYQTDFTNGAHFFLTAALGDNAGTLPDQAAAVGKTFVDRVAAAKFADFDVALTLTYRESSPNDSYVNGSLARVGYSLNRDAGGGPSGQAVAENLREWVQIADSPAIRHVRLELPSPSGPGSGSGFTLRPAPAAADAALADLVRAHPDLDRAAWRVVADPSDDTLDGRSSTYVLSGLLPDKARRDLWSRIVTAAQPAGDVEAETNMVSAVPGTAPTSVTVSISPGPTDKPFDRRVRDLMPLLAQLPSPVGVRILAEDRSIETTIGGCTRGGAGQSGAPLQTELRAQYEKC